ncbi:MAG: GGDEF domain-containing protein [Propionivibrio sp.]
MPHSFTSLLARPPAPKHRILIWCLGLLTIAALGFLHAATKAEFAFAAAAILPVTAVAWVGGRRDGFIFSALATGMWMSIDLLTERHYSPLWIVPVNAVVRIATYGLVSHLVARVNILLAREQDMARHDALTRLLNRRAFVAEGDDEVSRSRRYGHPVAVAFLDLDDFKTLNDSQGHEVGDRALQAVADALREALRVADQIARLGGDEFAVLLPEITYAAASEAGQKIAAAVDAAMKPFPPVSASVGVVWFETANNSFPAMLSAADALMYEIKQAGKHGVRTQPQSVSRVRPDNRSDSRREFEANPGNSA